MVSSSGPHTRVAPVLMGSLAFRNHAEVYKFPAETLWWEARYDIEKKCGMQRQKVDSVVVAYLQKDQKNEVALHDDYPIQEGDEIVLVRVPLGTRTDPWVPNPVLEKEWKEVTMPLLFNKLSARIREEKDEYKRLKLCQEQGKLAHSLPPHNTQPHPSHRVLLKTCSAWRIAPAELEPILPPTPGPRYTCQKCLNLLSPLHFVDDCPAPISDKKQWLWNKPLPHGVLRSTMQEVRIETPEDLLKVMWVDTTGRLWTRDTP